MRSRSDRAFLILTGLFVAALAIVAGAISFAHMVELSQRHDQTGWKAYAFPISVDGLEIVASLYLVAQRRAGRPTGWIPWVALVVGTLASLAANVAVGGHDVIGKALAGWPALSMLAAVKLLFGMFDHVEVDQPAVVWADQRTSLSALDVPGTDQGTGREESPLSGTVPCERTERQDSAATGPTTRPTAGIPEEAGAPGQTALRRASDPSDHAVTMDVSAVAHLVPAARAARGMLARDGRSLSRDNLAAAMRDDGHAVSNGRASLLLKILKAESGEATIVPVPLPANPSDTETLSDPTWLRLVRTSGLVDGVEGVV